MSTKEKTKIVFAVYPNAHGFGFVYMENERKLIDFGTVRIRPICNNRIFEKIKQTIDYFRPTIVVVPDPDCKSSRTGNRVRKLIAKIIEYGEQEKLPVFQYSRDQVRDIMESFGVTTKYEIARWLLTEFTELEKRKPKERKLWTSEDRNMAIFDALSLALTWFYLNFH
jgi:Holliday junction resolvasome RuvABC endonuclease subunit